MLRIVHLFIAFKQLSSNWGGFAGAAGMRLPGRWQNGGTGKQKTRG
jgi:hypothetical protein